MRSMVVGVVLVLVMSCHIDQKKGGVKQQADDDITMEQEELGFSHEQEDGGIILYVDEFIGETNVPAGQFFQNFALKIVYYPDQKEMKAMGAVRPTEGTRASANMKEGKCLSTAPLSHYDIDTEGQDETRGASFEMGRLRFVVHFHSPEDRNKGYSQVRFIHVYAKSNDGSGLMHFTSDNNHVTADFDTGTYGVTFDEETNDFFADQDECEKEQSSSSSSNGNP